MRVAAVYDIHGNLPALEAVLQEIREACVDQIVVGGDVVPGPMARETLECLLDLKLPVQFIQGNCEVAVLAEMGGGHAGPLPEQAREAIRWTARELQTKYQDIFAGWPKTVRMDIPGLGQVLFCHGTPRNENEIFTRLTRQDRLWRVFQGVDSAAVVCGHTHMQFERTIGKVRVVNAGSVGMPFGEPGAYWALLGPDIELQHTDYDLAKAAQRIRETAYPQAEDFATQYVLHPPSEEQMLAVFAKAELK
jgi:putative phosphoesterase